MRQWKNTDVPYFNEGKIQLFSRVWYRLVLILKHFFYASRLFVVLFIFNVRVKASSRMIILTLKRKWLCPLPSMSFVHFAQTRFAHIITETFAIILFSTAITRNATNILVTSLINTISLTCRESRWGAAWCYRWRVRDLCLSAWPVAAHPRRVPASTSQCQTQPDAIHTYGSNQPINHLSHVSILAPINLL